MPDDLDRRIRLAAFDWLIERQSDFGDTLPRSVLAAGFDLLGTRIPLVGPQGIFKPKPADLPISITTAPNGPYSDSFDPASGMLMYAYRGEDPRHRDNVGLRRAMTERVPLVFFFGTSPGRYVPTFPVYIVADDPIRKIFGVAADDLDLIDVAARTPGHVLGEDQTAIRRAYITTTVQRRLHQQAFRDRVIRAYRQRCALCRLRHDELLDAAHITPDIDPAGEPVVTNGLALCKLHHAAFDRFFLTVRPDYRVEVRPSILAEVDGPMLLVGLKQVHGQMIALPNRTDLAPDKWRLESRYEAFRRAS